MIAPDARDHHADHAATALHLAAVQRMTPPPTVLTYLVHDTVWPLPLKASGDFPAPGSAYAGTPWMTLQLESDEIATK